MSKGGKDNQNPSWFGRAAKLAGRVVGALGEAAEELVKGTERAGGQMAREEQEQEREAAERAAREDSAREKARKENERKQAAAAATTIQRVFRGTTARAAIKAEKAKEVAAFESMNNMFERSELAAQRRGKKDNQKANDIRKEEALENLQHMFGVRNDERLEELTQQNLQKRSIKDRFNALLKKKPRQGQLGEIDKKKAQLKQEEREIKARAAAERQVQEEERRRPIEETAQRRVTALSEKLTDQREFREKRNTILKEKKGELEQSNKNIKNTKETLSNIEKERQALEKQKKQLESAIQQANTITGKNQEMLVSALRREADASHDITAVGSLRQHSADKLPELQTTSQRANQELREFETELENIRQEAKAPLTKREQIKLAAEEREAKEFVSRHKTEQQKADEVLEAQKTMTGKIGENMNRAGNRLFEANSEAQDLVANLEMGEKSHAKLQAELARIQEALKDNDQRNQASQNNLSELQEESKALTKVVGSLEAEIHQQDLGIAATKAQQGMAIADQHTLAQMGISSDKVGKQISEGMSRARQATSENYERAKQGMSHLGSNISAEAQSVWNKLSPQARKAVQQVTENVKKPSIMQNLRTRADNLAKKAKKATGWSKE